MNDFGIKELQVIREGLECTAVFSDREAVKEATEKIDEMLKKKGYVFERKAFQNEWKKLDQKAK